ncbi:MAG: hypothetical protein K0S26_2697 [Bacteroidota bacterium]|jgi:hypothetical protein|nr:hypothetical protein [Bacteroidota bacterium]
MRRIQLYFGTLLFVCGLFSLKLTAQVTPKISPAVNKCGAGEIHKQLMINDPGYAQRMQQFESYMQTVPANLNKTSSIIYRVPVVVNVMHKGEAVGVGTNVSDAAIQNAIKIMNQMYRKEAGTAWDGNGVDVEIEYVLAVRDPNGNCTNGINRINMTGNSAYMNNGVNRNNSSGISDAALKAVFSWDQTKYYNIWLVYEIDNNEGGSGIQGYAYFASAHGQSYDGSVILASNFTSGTSTTAAHEIGHSLNLYHTFEGDDEDTPACPSASNGCGSGIGDCCGDIPAHMRSTSNCATGTNTCDGSSRELFIHNYMDYSSDVCQNMLTANQKSRMVNALTTTRATFLGPDYGGTNMALAPVTTAGVSFEASASILCGTGQSVKFTDRSTCIPNSYLSTSSFSGITHNWTITNGTTTYTSNVQNPTITFNSTGTFNVTLQITNANGTTSSTQTGMIVVSSGAPVSGCTPTSLNNGNFWQTIYNVGFNTFSNQTSKYINAAYTNNACSYNTIVTSGNSYPLTISANAEGNFGNEAFEVYIDYNNDGVFTNPSEMIFSGSAPSGTSGTYTTNVTIPSTVTATPNQLLRMRVIGELSSVGASDRTCSAQFSVGDVEDYGVYVKPAGCSAPTITGTTPSSRCGTGTLSIGATASTGTVNWYTAATGGTAIATGTSFTTPSLSSTTVYYVDATNAGCTTSSRTSVTASVNAIPTITVAANPTAICAGSTSTLTGSGASTYTWNPGALTGATIAVMPTTTTVYTVTGKSTLGCSTITTLNLTVSSTPTVTAVSSPTSICTGSSASLTASGASSYTWNPGAIVGTSVVVTPTATTIYTVIGKTGSCTNTRTVSLTVKALPTLTVTSTPTLLCNGNTGTLAVSGASTYTWNPGAVAGTTIAVTPTATTIYTVAGTSTLGCTATRTLNLTVSPIPTLTAVSSPTTICAGSFATLIGSGASTYTWNPGALTGSTISVSPTVTTTYTLNGRSAAGCTGTKTLNLIVNTTVVPSVAISQTGGSNPLCTGSSATFTATPTNGGTTPSYQWKVNGSNVGTNSSTYTDAGLTNGQTVRCVMTSNAACPSTPTASSSVVTMTVNSTVAPGITIAQISGTNPMCTGASSTFTATISNGGTTPVYQWMVDGINAGTNSPSFSATLNNGDAVTCLLTSNSACASTPTAISSALTMTVNSSSTPAVSIVQTSGNNPMCAGSASTFSATATNGGSSPDYQWMVNGVNAGTNSPSYSNTGLSNNDDVTCLLTSNSSCASTPTAISSAITITVSTPPNVTVNASPSTICSGSSSTLTCGGAMAYLWNTGETTLNISVSPGATTGYTVTGTDALGCSNTANVTITVTACSTETAVSSVPCGLSVNSMKSSASAVNVTGAIQYRFNFYNNSSNVLVATKMQSSRTFTFNTVSGIYYGNTYKWTVAVNKGNGFGPESNNSCTITFNPPQTSVTCGYTYANISAYTTCPFVYSGTGYRFTFYNNTTNALVAVKTQTSNYIYFNTVPGLAYGNTYKWTVEAQYNNGSSLLYGPPSSSLCTISFSGPQASLPCGVTYIGSNAYSSATFVSGANAYRFSFYDATTNALVAVKTNTNQYVYLGQVAGLIYNKTYKWTVETQYYNGSSYVFGPASSNTCTMTWGSASSFLFDGTEENSSLSRLSSMSTIDGEPMPAIIYPNPNNGQFIVDLSSDRELEISNILGERVINQFLSKGQNQINIIDQPAGIYFVKIKSGDKQQVIKIIKEN